MKQENGAVTRIAGLEEEFRRVRKESLVRREAELERMLKESMLGFDSEEEAEKYALEEQDKEMELLERCGLDEDKIKALDEEDEKYADRYLEVARPKLMASMSDPDDRHRRRIAQIDRMSRFGRIQPACVGGDVLASDKDTLERFAKRGKLGNPSVWFNDPNELRTFEVSQSGGWSTNACGAFGVQFGHYFAVEWWYIWTTLPHSSGMTSNLVLAQLDLTGFYLIRARDRWYNCKHAKARLRVDIDLFQGNYLWNGAKERQVFDDKVKNGNGGGVIDTPIVWDEPAQLEAATPTMLKVSVVAYVEGKGTGSRAEINFQDAVGSGVGPPLVLIAL